MPWHLYTGVISNSLCLLHSHVGLKSNRGNAWAWMVNTEDPVKSKIVLPCMGLKWWGRKGKVFPITPQKCRITFGCSPSYSPSEERCNAGLNKVMVSSPSHLLHSGVERTDENRAPYRKYVMRREEGNYKRKARGELKMLTTFLVRGVDTSSQTVPLQPSL